MKLQCFFVFDIQRCFGCFGCVAACANARQTSAEVRLRSVFKLPPEPGDHRTIYLSVACNHCAQPPCAAACPANALEKRSEDGIVVHHPERCLGCRYCQMACPYDAIKWDETTKTVTKCDFCYERQAQGREPACVETCFSGALKMEKHPVTGLSPRQEEQRHPGLTFLEHVGPSVLFKKIPPEEPITMDNTGD